MIRTVWAFILRDFRHEVSYKLSFVMQIVSSFHVILIFFFLSKLFAATPTAGLKVFGGSYFPFVLIGISVQQYLHLALNTYAGQLREAQMMGTFEAQMVCPVPFPIYLAGSVIYVFIFNTFHIMILIFLGNLLGGIPFSWHKVMPIFLILCLSAMAFSVIGILSASYCVIFKKGNPFAWLLSVTSSLLGGVYFPNILLPPWLRYLSEWIPTTHCLDAMRGIILQDRTVAGVGRSIGMLLLWSLIGIPLSCLCFSWALQRARRAGQLGQY